MPQKSPATLLTTFEKKRNQAAKDFAERHASAKQWLEKQGLQLGELREHATKLLTGATLSSALLLASPLLPIFGQTGQTLGQQIFKSSAEFKKFLQNLSQQTDAAGNEELITKSVEKFFGVQSIFELDHNRLPTYFGSMGLEQHLVRFPGDTISQHQAFIGEGMAPALGSFGYFSDTDTLTPEAIERERFYIVLRTFDVPDWNTQWQTLKEWYKFRKFLVINPQNGKAVIAVLGDAGPAAWTGKQFGGSPEVMAGLGFYPQFTRGDVIVLFLDDPGNTVPLGPLTLREEL